MFVWEKSLEMFKFTIMIAFLITSTTSITANANASMPPDVWPIRRATYASGCINLTGEYQQWGESSPQGPATFRGMPFSLDIMVGPYVSYYDRKRITHVGVEHRKDNEIIFTFFTKDGVLAQRKHHTADKVKILCTADRVTMITTSLETKGEATRGTADIIDTFFQAEDGSLIIHTVIKGTQNFLFFFKIRDEEEYWAKFKPIEKR